MNLQASSGGAAAAGGMDFQHRVAAWVAVYVLAEKAASPPWSLPADTVLEWFRCETEQPVDDLLVGTSGSGLVFCQIKRRLNLSADAGSDLASALDQFVRQFTTCRTDLPLDPARDRLVLITSPGSSEPIRVHLPNVLRRVRNLTSGQALDEAATADEERRALSEVVKHIRNSWQALLNGEPSDEELRQLLSLIRVHVLDVDVGAPGEQEAKNLLRSEVLRDPDQADQAWTALVTLCAGYAAQRSGADRAALQRELLNTGLDLKVPRSYEEDIKRLRRHSQQTLGALAHLAQIRVGSTTIRTHRACTEALRQAAEEGSILVTGEPGAGKSGALHDFAEALRDGGRDCVLLAVDRLAAVSLGQLREELGLEHELPEVLENWPGLQPAFLVIDALDAARADPAGAMVRDLIRHVVAKGGRWRVVASIRKFDLRYGVEIQQLFAGNPPTQFVDPEFQRVRHLNIPRFSEEELTQIGSESPPLQELIANALPELQDLLRVPFNLRLMAELLGGGVTLDELTPIRTQLELLDRYWRHRVVRSDGQGDAREAILREVCEQMVGSRVLRADRAAVARPETSALLNDLLSTQVLIEWQASPDAPPDRYLLAFSHHVLFDYAVARLLFRGNAETVIRRLAEDPELVIVIRPSLVLHFRHLWDVTPDRLAFWDVVFRVIANPEIPEVGKLIGPAVAAELARSTQDLEPVCAALEQEDEEKHGPADGALRHLVGALLAGMGYKTLAGPNAGPWCELLERVSRRLRPSVAYTVRALLATVCDHPESFTPEQRTAAGHAARRLLEFAWSQVPRDSWLVVHALQCVCRTFESDPAASSFLIGRCLEPVHLSQFGFEEMLWLAREVRRLIKLDPTLVASIYCAAFGHQEESQEPTPIGGSRIFPLVSNRRQHYESALYQLAESFPAFLETAPEQATRTLVRVLESYVGQRHSQPFRETQQAVFDFRDQQARLLEDYSSVWDEGDTYREEEPIKMLDAFQNFLEGLATEQDSKSTLRALIGIFVSENELAVAWRRLLLAGARFPETLGLEILPLAWAVPILTCHDTTVPAGDYLKAVFPILRGNQRRKIERAILGIPDAMPADRREEAEQVRDRLLGCLPLAAIVTDEAHQKLAELQAHNAVPPNQPPVGLEEEWFGTYGEEDYLEDQGVPVEAEGNRRIRELERPVKEFADRHLNSTPTLEEAHSVLPALRALYDALGRADADDVHPKQKDYAWGILAQGCARIARAEGLSGNEEPGTFIMAVLLEACRHHEPVHDPQYDAQFDEHPSWGSPAARIDAAQGLIILASHQDCATPYVLKAIEALSDDPVPAVRYQIAARLNALYRTAHELMWSIIERLARKEASRGVLQGLLVGPLGRLVGAEPDRVANVTKAIFERISAGPGANRVREFCMSILAGLYIWRDHPLSRDVVHEIVSNPAGYPAEAGHVLRQLRNTLTHGPTDPSDPQADAIRRRALELLNRLLRSSRDGLKELDGRHAGVGFDKWPQADQKTAQSLMRLVDAIGREVYFASGAYDAKSQGQARGVREVTPQSKRFYQEASAILDELTDAPLPSVAHHLLETLEHFIPVDPRGVFLRIHRVVSAGQQAGYQYESMAAELIVRLVERYLAEYRTLLQQDVACRRALIEVLDVFVKAGWPSARRLAYRLEEIFR
jgi:hypothetical protein